MDYNNLLRGLSAIWTNLRATTARQ